MPRHPEDLHSSGGIDILLPIHSVCCRCHRNAQCVAGMQRTQGMNATHSVRVLPLYFVAVCSMGHSPSHHTV